MFSSKFPLFLFSTIKSILYSILKFPRERRCCSRLTVDPARRKKKRGTTAKFCCLFRFWQRCDREGVPAASVFCWSFPRVLPLSACFLCHHQRASTGIFSFTTGFAVSIGTKPKKTLRISLRDEEKNKQFVAQTTNLFRLLATFVKRGTCLLSL